MYMISSGDIKVRQSLVEIQIQSGGNHIGSHSEELLWDEERCPIFLWDGSVKRMITAATNIY